MVFLKLSHPSKISLFLDRKIIHGMLHMWNSKIGSRPQGKSVLVKKNLISQPKLML